MSTKNKPKSNKVKGTRQEIKYTNKKKKRSSTKLSAELGRREKNSRIRSARQMENGSS